MESDKKNMRKVILYIAMSLDGYVADKEGGIDWLEGQEVDSNMPETYNKLMERIDTVILGYNTYNQVINELSPDVWPYEGMKSYIFTSRDVEETSEIKKADKPLVEFIKYLKNEEGKDIWICGGASIANQLIKNDMIDRYQISILPIILGSGIKLFNEDLNIIKLQLMNTDVVNGITELTYERR